MNATGMIKIIKYFVITITVSRSPPTEKTFANIDPNDDDVMMMMMMMMIMMMMMMITNSKG